MAFIFYPRGGGVSLNNFSDPGITNVVFGIQYKFNSATNNRTGSRDTVTCLLDNVNLTAPEFEAVLEAE